MISEWIVVWFGNSKLWYDLIVWFGYYENQNMNFNQDIVFSGKKIPC